MYHVTCRYDMQKQLLDEVTLVEFAYADSWVELKPLVRDRALRAHDANSQGVLFTYADSLYEIRRNPDGVGRFLLSRHTEVGGFMMACADPTGWWEDFEVRDDATLDDLLARF